MVSGISKSMPLSVSYGSNILVSKSASDNKVGGEKQYFEDGINHDKNLALYGTALSSINKLFLNKHFVNFKGYDGDPQPLRKLFYITTGRDEVYEDDETNRFLYQVGTKKWVNRPVGDILKRPLEQTLQSIFTLTKPNDQYPGIPMNITPPNIGGYESDKWGRHANYIEINPRIVAKYDKGTVTEGLFGAMKLMTALPPSSDKIANCIILSQLYPAFNNDGRTDSDGLYRVRLHDGISHTLTSPGLFTKMGADEQVRAFNDAAHKMGFKTGFRMPLSEGQMKIHDEDFDWWHQGHERAFIEACKWGIDLGFDAIYFDSGKHVVTKDFYQGQGKTPDFFQMQRITNAIRQESQGRDEWGNKYTGRNDLSFIGEKCDKDDVFRRSGYTAGTDWGRADNFESVRWEARTQKGNRDYAGGPDVSNDNDLGWISYEDRINRTKSALYGYDFIEDKLPAFFQINDFFPLNDKIHTKKLMEYPYQSQDSWAKEECIRHWESIFSAHSPARDYTQAIYHEFEQAMYR